MSLTRFAVRVPGRKSPMFFECDISTATVMDLKKIIQEKTEIPILEQVIQAGDFGFLKDDDLLSGRASHVTELYVLLKKEVEKSRQMDEPLPSPVSVTPKPEEETKQPIVLPESIELYIEMPGMVKQRYDVFPAMDEKGIDLKKYMQGSEGYQISYQTMVWGGKEVLDDAPLVSFLMGRNRDIYHFDLVVNPEGNPDVGLKTLNINFKKEGEDQTEKFYFDPSRDTLLDLKKYIQRKAGIPMEQQRVLIMGQEMVNGYLLRDYSDMQPGKPINLVIAAPTVEMKQPLSSSAPVTGMVHRLQAPPLGYGETKKTALEKAFSGGPVDTGSAHLDAVIDTILLCLKDLNKDPGRAATLKEAVMGIVKKYPSTDGPNAVHMINDIAKAFYDKGTPLHKTANVQWFDPIYQKLDAVLNTYRAGATETKRPNKT